MGDRTHPLCADSDRRVDLLFDFRRDRGVLLQERLRLLAALTETVLTVGVMRARLGHHLVPHGEIEQAACRGDAPAVLDIELGLPERRGHLVLDDLYPHTVTDGLATAVFERLNTADVQPLGGIELQRA